MKKLKLFSDKQKLRTFATSKPTLKEMLKNDLEAEAGWTQREDSMCTRKWRPKNIVNMYINLAQHTK